MGGCVETACSLVGQGIYIFIQDIIQLLVIKILYIRNINCMDETENLEEVDGAIAMRGN